MCIYFLLLLPPPWRSRINDNSVVMMTPNVYIVVSNGHYSFKETSVSLVASYIQMRLNVIIQKSRML